MTTADTVTYITTDAVTYVTTPNVWVFVVTREPFGRYPAEMVGLAADLATARRVIEQHAGEDDFATLEWEEFEDGCGAAFGNRTRLTYDTDTDDLGAGQQRPSGAIVERAMHYSVDCQAVAHPADEDR